MKASLRILIADFEEQRDKLDATIEVLTKQINGYSGSNAPRKYIIGGNPVNELIAHLTKVGESTFDQASDAIGRSVASLYSYTQDKEIFAKRS